MSVKKIFICTLISVFIVLHAEDRRKEVIGYYPSWKWKLKHNVMMPENIPYDKLTIINYAFFYPLPDGRIVGRDTVGDNLILKGNGREPGSSLVELAHRRGVKVMPSLGGWEESHSFPEVAASESKRMAFAHACIELIKQYDFDGIDIDWEFPGYTDHKGTPQDKYNFTKLLQITKDSLTSYGKKTGRTYLLTAALPASADALKEYEIQKVSEQLDMLNIMTYDFNGSWSPKSGHNAPLYAPNSSDAVRNIDAAFKLYSKTLNIPASKINVGVPFYGHTYTHCTALESPHKGTDTVHFSQHGAFYYDIIKSVNTATRKWDDKSKVPYLVIPEWNTLISYDDEESVGHKAQYVIDNDVRGLIIWEITGDYLENGATPLLDVINSKFNSHKKK